MRKVELMPAFFFTCDYCGEENYVRAMIKEMTTEQKESIARQLNNLEEWEEVPEGTIKNGMCMLAPTKVRCKSCETAYGVLPFGMDFPRDDDDDHDGYEDD